jgi:hypothetical protein
MTNVKYDFLKAECNIYYLNFETEMFSKLYKIIGLEVSTFLSLKKQLKLD